MWSVRRCSSSEHRLSFKLFKIPIGNGEEADRGKEKIVVLEGRSICKKRNRSDVGKKGVEINGGSGCCSTISTDQEVKCDVCSRCFGSLKAMHGHMRSHPERERRGKNPPPPPPLSPSAKPAAPSFAVSSLTSTSTELLSDASRPLKKRSYALFSAEETLALTLALPIPPAASKNVNSDNTSGSFSNYIISSDQKEIEGKKLQDLKNEMVGEGAYYSSGLRGQEDSWKNFLMLGFNNYGADDVASTTANKKEAAKQGVHNHKCRTCGKVFATGQALGGHQTTHRRTSVQHPEVSGQNAASSVGVLNFDLNELPPESFQGKLHSIPLFSNMCM